MALPPIMDFPGEIWCKLLIFIRIVAKVCVAVYCKPPYAALLVPIVVSIPPELVGTPVRPRDATLPGPTGQTNGTEMRCGIPNRPEAPNRLRVRNVAR
ncbi:hypothetical protein Cenrod_1811 [Candidatus Symbiobacter mobilis CR]|uniref:Uncharacterized protein n=1 Tax=Candidatus Symbiobacter mobilis CR TaxID=946483 RepID=U5N9B6_9BURK|nr:hypothetical protein Cenrod_1811 [Candidatus Symbiobacter mobilis CR]